LHLIVAARSQITMQAQSGGNGEPFAVEQLILEGDGRFPNNQLPVLLYRGALSRELRSADACLRRFEEHGWSNAWVDGIFEYPHFHSTTHEVLGIVSGVATLALGGPSGRIVEVEAGDVLILPAGTAHENRGHRNLQVVGAYPGGADYDIRRGDPSEYEDALVRIRTVGLPEQDPLLGKQGPLVTIWPGDSPSD
jgi:uncharacterized protein YjlB